MKTENTGENPRRALSGDLTRKLIWMVSAIFVVTSLVSYWRYSSEARELHTRKSSEYLEYLRDNLRVPLWNVDREWIDSICGSFARNESVGLLKVAGEDGVYLFAMENEAGSNLIVKKSEVIHKERVIGTVELGITTRLYEKRNYQILFRSILQMIAVIIGLMITTRFILERIVRRPLDHLILRIDEISAGRYREGDRTFAHRETAAILSKFNHMAARIRRRETALMETNRRLEAEIAERREAEAALRVSEHRYRQLVEELPVGMFRSSPDADGPFLMANPALVAMFGVADEGVLLERPAREFYREPVMRRRVLEMLLAEESVQGLEVAFTKADGTRLCGLISAHIVRDDAGAPLHVDGIIEDITGRKNLERRMRQAQKMESIGTLASGIAHDFNNILSTMFGFTEVVKMRHAAGRQIEEPLEEVLTAGIRARGLVRQILTFSRQTEERNEPTLVGPIVKETMKFLRASLPSTIEIKSDIRPVKGTVLADPTRIHQVMMNLCANAAQAMKEGGVLFVSLDEISVEKKVHFSLGRMDEPTDAETGKKSIKGAPVREWGDNLPGNKSIKDVSGFEAVEDEPLNEPVKALPWSELPETVQGDGKDRSPSVRYGDDKVSQVESGEKQGDFSRAELAVVDSEEIPGPGNYVRLTVSDSGHGIKEAWLERIFEPFFTSKPRGEGTGMGLAVVHGIVANLGGTISVDSRPGQGATFHVLLPCLEEPGGTGVPESTLSRTGGGRILFVDDEEGFVVSGREILEQIGYDVTTSCCPEEALSLFLKAPGGFDLVVTDMMMPKMTGIELGKRIREIRRDLPILLCTGFSNRVEEKARKQAGIGEVLMKPLLARELAVAVEAALEGEGCKGA